MAGKTTALTLLDKTKGMSVATKAKIEAALTRGSSMAKTAVAKIQGAWKTVLMGVAVGFVVGIALSWFGKITRKQRQIGRLVGAIASVVIGKGKNTLLWGVAGGMVMAEGAEMSGEMLMKRQASLQNVTPPAVAGTPATSTNVAALPRASFNPYARFPGMNPQAGQMVEKTEASEVLKALE